MQANSEDKPVQVVPARLTGREFWELTWGDIENEAIEIQRGMVPTLPPTIQDSL